MPFHKIAVFRSFSVGGISFPNTSNGRKTIQKEIASLIRKQCDSKVFKSVIRTNVALEEATMACKCVYDLDLKCSGSVDYLSLFNEILSNNL